MVGVPAGVAGGALATVLHAPTGLLLGWVATVARVAASAPLGRLGAAHLALLAAGLVAVGLLRRGRGPAIAVAGATVAVVAAFPAVAPRPLEGTEIAPGARLWRRGGASLLVVDGTRSAAELLGAAHRANVRRLDVLVVARPGPAAAAVVQPLRRRVPTRLVLVPAGSDDAEASVPEAGTSFTIGSLTVHVEAVRPRLQVWVGRVDERTPPDAARSPPPAWRERSGR